MRIEPGKIINAYQIKSLIGSGGMGEIYLAEEQLLGRQVAIKRLNPQLTGDAHFSERFINEARIQAKLIHPNIVALYNFFIHDNEYYMVMEYAEGQTLRDLIASTGPIPEARAMKFFQQIAQALSYAHSKSIIHRDIKPGNIMVDQQDNVKIMDFGIARIVSDSHLTKTGMKVGTIYYMSPEQIVTPKEVDCRTDIYSLGIVLFEMLTGQLPFTTDSESDFIIQKEIVDNILPDPKSFYPYISSNFIDLVSQLTVKNPLSRPSIDDVIARLQGRIPRAVQSSAHEKVINKAPQENQTLDNTRTDTASIPAQSIDPQPVEIALPKRKSKGTRNFFVILIFLVVLGIPTYSYFKQEQVWNRAIRFNSSWDYKHYLILYPQGRHAHEARYQYEQMRWNEVESQNRIEVYQEYLLEFPDGAYHKVANEKYEELFWQEVERSNTKSDYAKYLQLFPSGKYLKEARQGTKYFQYHDDFSTPSKTFNDYEDENMKWTHINNVFKGIGKSQGYSYKIYEGIHQLTDCKRYTISVDVCLIKGSKTNVFGLLFDGDDSSSSSLRFGVTANGSYYIGSFDQGSWKGDFFHGHVNESGYWNNIRIERKGNTVYFYVNSMYVLSWNIGKWGNTLGLYFEEDQEVLFDNLKISGDY